MARTCWNNRNRPKRDWIVNAVEDFLASVEDWELIDEPQLMTKREWQRYERLKHPVRSFLTITVALPQGPRWMVRQTNSLSSSIRCRAKYDSG